MTADSSTAVPKLMPSETAGAAFVPDEANTSTLNHNTASSISSIETVFSPPVLRAPKTSHSTISAPFANAHQTKDSPSHNTLPKAELTVAPA